MSGADPAGLARELAAWAGAAPLGVWAAPGRVNLIGEHTDYNDGVVLPFALEQRTAVALARRGDDRLRLRSLQVDGDVEVELAALAPGSPEGWAGYAAGVVWALREAGHEVPALDVLVDGGVPVGSGLSSSAALECAVALACAELFGGPPGRMELARLAQRAENGFVGVPSGLMDQAASLLCEAGHALAFDVRSAQTAQVPFDPAAAGLALLVIDTRASHSLGDGAYGERRRTCEEAAARLGVPSLRDVDPAGLDAALARLDEDVQRRRVRHVVTEIARAQQVIALLRAGDLPAVGPVMDASHRSLREDYEVSAPELDTAVDAARAAGALGARMTGGGFGGSAIALVPADRADAVTAAVEAAFAGRGFAPPQVLVAVPSEGARRLA